MVGLDGLGFYSTEPPIKRMCVQIFPTETEATTSIILTACNRSSIRDCVASTH